MFPQELAFPNGSNMRISGLKFIILACALMLGLAVIPRASSQVAATSPQTQKSLTQSQKPQSHKKKMAKKVEPPPPPLPSGPTGPVQQMPLDSITAMAPQVTFQNNELTIVAPNSTLGDILRAVRKQTGAEIDIPPAPERVVTHLGPGPARTIVAQLLNGSRFNYVLLGSPADQTVLTRVVLVAKSGPEATPGAAAPVAPGANTQPGIVQANNAPEDRASDAEAEAAEENMNVDTSAAAQEPTEPEEPANNNGDPAVKTPQQMLQEMQQRQMQLQQQQQQQGGSQAPAGSGMPAHPPQEQ